ncbi:hypothetical protein GCM10022291_28370 [Postechiella marina]|uniref:HTH araC/xylS-type domain-containing protein n=1 Tax=Postechiella marina TaxID=943941 RepID=A0ABP8CEL9_9FLAO
MYKELESLTLDILHAGYAKLDSSWKYDDVISPFSRLFYVTTGNASVFYTNQWFKLEPGYLYLIPSFTYNSYYCEKYHEQFYVSFFEEVQQGMSIYNLKQFKYKVKATKNDALYFKRLVEINPDKVVTDSKPKAHINRSLSEKNKGFNAHHYMETQGILSVLFSRFILDADVDNLGGSDGDLNKVLIYIAKNLKNDLSIAVLARYCNFSEDHFSRSFNASFGIRPNKYIQQKRIEKAQFLLVTTEKSLKQIAAEVGLANISYFSRTFKKIVGNSPANFRKQHFDI